MIVVVGGRKAQQLAGHGGDPWNLGDLRNDGLWHGPAEWLGDAPAPDREVGAALLEALLHVLLHAARQAIQRDETADGERHAKRRQHRRAGLRLRLRKASAGWFTSPPYGPGWPLLLVDIAILDPDLARAALGVNSAHVSLRPASLPLVHFLDEGPNRIIAVLGGRGNDQPSQNESEQQRGYQARHWLGRL